MREGWTYKKLGEVCAVLNGLWVGKKEPLINIAVIRNTNFSKDCKLKLDDVAYIDVEERQFLTRKLQVGDIIIEKSGGSDKQPVGRPVLFNISEGDYSFSNFTATLRLIDGSINPKFLHKCLYGYYRNGETKRMQSKTTGLHNLDMKAYLRLPIPCLSISEQQRIVSELDLLSSIVEKKKAQLKEYDQLAQSIFYDMFGDPVTNEKGWEVKRLSDLCALSQGLAINSKSKYLLSPFGELPLLRIKDMKEGTREIFVNSKECPNSCIADIDDIIYTRTGTLGLVFTNMHGVLHNNCFKINIDKKLLSKIFFMSMIGGEDFRKSIIEKAKRSSQPDVTHKLFLSQSIILPPLSLQQSFATKIEAIERQKALIQQSIIEAETLFNSRMDYYFN